MSLVNRLLDTFFRVLDTVDMARDRVDRALGRHAQPWTAPGPSDAPPRSAGLEPAPAPPRVMQADGAAMKTSLVVEPTRDPTRGSAAPDRSTKKGSTAKRATTTKKGTGSAKAGRSPRTAAGRASAATRSAPTKAQAKPAPRAAARGNAETLSTTTARNVRPGSGTNRKGSVDRSGKDLDSPRAKAILEKLKARQGAVVTDDAALEGKRVLARVLWALGAADEAGSELGLTAADASALLHLAAGMEVFSTNVARACRDEGELIEETTPDGRSKRYRLTAAGKRAAAGLPTRAIHA